jgi:hypothetical protein
MPSKTVNLAFSQLPSTTVAQGSTELVLSPSVYDVPRSATIDVDELRDLLRVSFAYVDDEDAEEQALDEGLALELGKKSGKLLAFVLKLPAVQIHARLAKGVDLQLARSIRDNQRLNLWLIKQALAKDLAPLLPSK